MIAQYATFAMAAILIVAVALEVKTGRIPNWLTLLPIVVFIAVLGLSDDRSALYWQIGLAAGVFAVGLLLFMFAGFGAGAVKLMAGTALFVPFAKGGYALLVFIVVLFVGSLVIVFLRRAFGSESSSWYVMSKPVSPMSIPIACAGIAAMFWL
jgi:prepilin peptidase CpaA